MTDIVCKRCGRVRKLKAKELCDSCYVRVRQIAEGDDWLKRHAESERKRRKRLGPEYRRKERERNKRRKEQRKQYMKEYMQHHRKRISRYFMNYRKREPQKERAREAVHYQVKNGRMPSPLTLECEECGQPAKDYHHHHGYEEEFKLDVIPLCKRCHGKTDRID